MVFHKTPARRDTLDMKTKTAWATPLIILATCLTACSRKAEQAGPPPPTVIVATVTPRDVPVVKEGVATLDGFINANINAQVQGYIISRDYKEGSVVKKAICFSKSIRALSKLLWPRRKRIWQKTKRCN